MQSDRFNLAAVALAFAAAISASPARADDHPDDCSSATLNPNPELRCSGVLEAATDVDWFRVPVLPAHLYSLHDFWLNCDQCARVRVVSNDCSTGLVDLFGLGPGDVYWFIAPPAGEVFVAVEQPSAGVRIGDEYDVRIQHVQGPVTDDYPDTIGAPATVPTDGTWINGLINHRLDRDAFRFRGLAGHVYLIDANPADQANESLVNITIADGLVNGVRDTIDARNPFWGQPGGPWGTRIRVDDGDDRDIGVLVDGGGVSWAAPRSYRLRVVDEGPLPATSPTSDNCETPVEMPIGQTFTVQAPEPENSVYWVMPVVQGHVYEVACLATVGSHDLGCSTGAACNALGALPGYGLGGRFQAIATGEAHFGLGRSGPYYPDDVPAPAAWATFRVVDLGWIQDDSPAGSPPVPIAADGVWRTFHTDFVQDEDRFAVAAEPGSRLDLEFVAETPGWGGGLSAGMEGYLGAGSGFDDASDVRRFSFYVPADYTGVLDVGVTGDAIVGAYRLRAIEWPAEGARGDGCGSFIVAPTDGTARRVVFDDADGEDWVGFQAAAMHAYRVEVSDVVISGYFEKDWATSCDGPLRPLPYGSPRLGRDSDGPILLRILGRGVSDVAITDLGIPEDPEPDVPDGAVLPRLILPNRAPVAGRLDGQSDVDYFRVRLNPGHRYALGAGTPGGLGRAVVSLCTRDGDCVVSGGALLGTWFIAPGDPGSAPIELDLRLTASGFTSSGQYLVRLTSWGCPSDWNDDGERTQADLFAFLDAMLAGDPEADLDGSGVVGVEDLFTYLTAWFGSCW